jgi:hypothetical protein
VPIRNLLLLVFIGATLAKAAGAPATPKPYTMPRSAMDTTRIHKIYLDGEFDDAIDKLESGLKYARPLSHEDSVFIFKHLGVMYTSKYETREMGKKYMMQLLTVEPTARIMDMYASDMIYMIFKNIKDEFDLAQLKLQRVNALKDASLTPATKPPKENTEPATGGSKRPALSKSNHTWIWWTAGAVALGAGVGIFLWSQQENDQPKPARNLVPGNGT